mgnify:CR=1 FL=1
MFPRQLNILKSNSFFLFGARGTGKTSLLQSIFETEHTLWIDLLDEKEERDYSKNPDLLRQRVKAMEKPPSWVVIDEVQKVPKLLDVVHKLIESTSMLFALTGSSARKLKRGGANLLAGRAFVYHLYPLTHHELGDQFALDHALQWGTLPKVNEFGSDSERELFLEAYCNTYLKEEVLVEQLVRNVTPFRRFLEVAAQMNGEIVNYSKIASDIDTDPKTVKTYYDIVEDTLLGFQLPAYERSIRKQITKSPKFYLFDTGVKRALEESFHIALKPGDSAYGKAFEHFIIAEIARLNTYLRRKYKLSYIRSSDGQEIDLILSRKGESLKLIEIKSTSDVQERQLKHLGQLSAYLGPAQSYCICCESQAREVDGVMVLPWKQGIQRVLEID